MRGVTQAWANADAAARRLAIRYAILTAALCLPLLWAFLAVRNLYPFAAWTVMMAGGDLARGHSYGILRGETVSGETIDVAAIDVSRTLHGRNFGMVNATIANQAFTLPSIHPLNQALLERHGGVEHLPSGARIPDLLLAWGRLYNQRQPASSPTRLKAIRLDRYRWHGGSYAEYATFVESWRQEL